VRLARPAPESLRKAPSVGAEAEDASGPLSDGLGRASGMFSNPEPLPDADKDDLTERRSSGVPPCDRERRKGFPMGVLGRPSLMFETDPLTPARALTLEAEDVEVGRLADDLCVRLRRPPPETGRGDGASPAAAAADLPVAPPT